MTADENGHSDLCSPSRLTAGGGPRCTSACVVVIEPTLVLGTMLSVALETYCRIELAGNIEGALALLSRVSPQLIILDMALPGPDPLTLADGTRTRQPSVRFLILGSALEPALMRRLARLGIEGAFQRGHVLSSTLRRVATMLSLPVSWGGASTAVSVYRVDSVIGSERRDHAEVER
jgi:CheY-like chemotaxis protein